MASDPEVKKAQQSLICRCFLNHGDDDGIYGAVTAGAVYAYQLGRSHPGLPWGFSFPLTADHILGPNTKARLNPPQIKNGDHGKWVKLCQEILTWLAHNGGSAAWDPLGIDGAFGPKTEAAVKAFQGDHTEPPAPKGNGKPLLKDGIVGPITWCALRS